MNERIRLLAIEAGGGPSKWYNDPNVLEQFAQLIVGDCLDIVDNADMTELEGPDPEDVLYVACKQIKKTFRS